jgi:hypothetical protein
MSIKHHSPTLLRIELPCTNAHTVGNIISNQCHFFLDNNQYGSANPSPSVDFQVTLLGSVMLFGKIKKKGWTNLREKCTCVERKEYS